MFIYLDQNKWIELSRAIINNDPNYKEVIAKIISKIESGEWVFPLSMIHLIETAKRVDDGSRKRLSIIMGSLSRGYTIVPYLTLNRNECENSIKSLMGLPSADLQELAIKRDHLNLVGLDAKNLDILSVLPTNERDNFLDMVAEKYNFFAIISDLENKNGIADEVREERVFYFDILKNLQQEQLKLIAETEPKNRKYLYPANLINCYMNEYKKLIPELLTELNVSQEQFLTKTKERFKNKTATLEHLESIPGFNVSNRLIYDIVTNPHRKIDINDFYDITFLSVAVPYCDVVITENLWFDRICYHKLDKKYNMQVSSKLHSLLDL